SMQMAHVRRVFEDRPWHALLPDLEHTVVTAGYGTFVEDSAQAHLNSDFVTAAATADGKLIMAYVPPTGTMTRILTVNMRTLSRPATARWFDPANGQYTTAGKGAYDADDGLQETATPGPNSAGQ